MLDKIELEEIVPSSRKYPFINFKAEREIGNDLLTVENLSVKIDGETILDNISFILRPGDKTALYRTERYSNNRFDPCIDG